MIGRAAGCRLGSSKPDEKVRLFQRLPIVNGRQGVTCSTLFNCYYFGTSGTTELDTYGLIDG